MTTLQPHSNVPAPAGDEPPTSITILEARGALDSAMVDDLRRQVIALPAGPRVVPIRCDELDDLDPVGATALWRLCEEAQSRDHVVVLVDLPLRFAWRLRRHPLLNFVSFEEALFENPFGGFSPSPR